MGYSGTPEACVSRSAATAPMTTAPPAGAGRLVSAASPSSHSTSTDGHCRRPSPTKGSGSALATASAALAAPNAAAVSSARRSAFRLRHRGQCVTMLLQPSFTGVGDSTRQERGWQHWYRPLPPLPLQVRVALPQPRNLGRSRRRLLPATRLDHLQRVLQLPVPEPFPMRSICVPSLSH